MKTEVGGTHCPLWANSVYFREAKNTSPIKVKINIMPFGLFYKLFGSITGKLEKNYSLTIRQQSKSQNGSYKKRKYARFFEKRTFLTP